MLKTCL